MRAPETRPHPTLRPRRRGRTAAAASLAAGALLLAACTSEGTEVAATGGSTVPAAGTEVETAPSTTPAPPSTELPATPPPTPAPTPAPTEPPTTAPPTTAPPGPFAGRQRSLSPTAPPPNPGVNVYAATGPDMLSPATAGARSLVYVPHEISGETTVIDPATRQIVDSFTTGAESHHVIPSWDLSTLYVAASGQNLLTEIDPTTGGVTRQIPVTDPYNLYFTPDGSEAIVVAEAFERLDFRDPRTFELNSSVQTDCAGINHLDYSADLSYFVASCEFDGRLIKFDLASRSVVASLRIDMGPSGRTARNGHAQPQDVRLSPDGSVFFVADLQSDGLYVIDGERFEQVGFIPAGVGTHSLYPSRDGTKMYVINRGTNIVGGPPHGRGSVSVLDPLARQIVADWPVPGGGSPDMGNITADGTELWLGGRYDGEVYIYDLVGGGFSGRIRVGTNPHGLIVWPQPGRMSLGHTGNLR